MLQKKINKQTKLSYDRTHTYEKSNTQQTNKHTHTYTNRTHTLRSRTKNKIVQQAYANRIHTDAQSYISNKCIRNICTNHTHT